MDKEDEQEIVLASVSMFFKSIVAVLVSLVTAAILGMWSMICNINIQQIKESAAIEKMHDEMNMRLSNDENDIAAIKKHENK